MHRQEDVGDVVQLDDVAGRTCDRVVDVGGLDRETRHEEVVDEVEVEVLRGRKDDLHGVDGGEVDGAGAIRRVLASWVLLLRDEPLAPGAISVTLWLTKEHV